MAVHVLTKKVVGKLYIKIHILYVQQYDRRTISISAVSNANWISLKFTRNIRLGYSSFIYCDKDRKNAHIKQMIWHNIMTFEHNDKKNARYKLVVGHILMAFGRNDKKNAHSN